MLQRNELIEGYTDYVHTIVRQLMRKLGLPEKLYDEFVSAGYLGLVEAADRYDPGNGTEFKNYAYLRIRGSIIDSIRKSSELKGKAYKYAKAMKSMLDLKAEEYTSKTSDTKEELTLSLERIFEYAALGALSYKMSFNDQETYESASKNALSYSPEEIVDLEQKKHIIRKHLNNLSEKERYVLYNYYFEDKTLEEIGVEVDGISKSWVSRIHKKALQNLKKEILKQHENFQL